MRRKHHKPKPDYTYRDSFPDLSDLPGHGYIIAYSGGSDSTVLTQMALEVAGDAYLVKPFMMSLLPYQLDYYRFYREFAQRRWGVTVKEYQHWSLSWLIRRGIFRYMADASWPRVTLADVEANARLDTGFRWIGYGYKSIDSLQRRGMMSKWKYGVCPEREVFCPLKDWADHHVQDFLLRKRLGQPLDPAYRTHGIDMSPECMHWLRRFWPADYAKMLKLFPLAVAQADRWEEHLFSGKPAARGYVPPPESLTGVD